ncbi:MAG: DivIVA domain-containing protein [Phascolarctobacterium sp.]|nr:DivIVA domain-containing protein [Candidatus Phascolarctobacterium equi]
MLTPDDLKGKVFKKEFFGYNPKEVDEFIGKITKEFEYLYLDNMNMKDSIERISSKLEYYQRMETTLRSPLTMSRDAADEVRENSMRRASVIETEIQIKSQKILEDARNQANNMLAEANNNCRKIMSDAEEQSRKMIFEAETKVTEAKNDYDNLVKKTEDFRNNILNMMETQIGVMKNYQTALAACNGEESAEQK